MGKADWRARPRFDVRISQTPSGSGYRQAGAYFVRPSGFQLGKGGGMNWMTDKITLIVVACVCAAGAWALLHYSGQYFFPVITIVAVACFYADNRRLRALLKKNGIGPRSNGRQL
ncbi:hypothetical protein [Paraburkholderia azotifigens]|uniref:Uncharacterized protein n=2 Tax=Paraburkholderia azotifigens TaxID=2057004 RepID=A0ABU9QUQ1_9BURK|nr:hypothetical protein [Paraburkholderia azotifigens]